MSVLKGKGLLYLLGMNLFERGTSPAGQGSFATEHPPHRQDQCKEKRGQVMQGVSRYASTDKAENSAVLLLWTAANQLQKTWRKLPFQATPLLK